MLIRHGDFIKHKNFKDVCVRVQKVFGPFNDKYLIKGEYWNMGYNDPWRICEFKHKIDINDITNWLILEKSEDNLRTGKWIFIRI